MYGQLGFEQVSSLGQSLLFNGESITEYPYEKENNSTPTSLYAKKELMIDQRPKYSARTMKRKQRKHKMTSLRLG